MSISEQPIPADEIADLTAFAESVYASLPQAKPGASRIDVVDEAIYTWQQSGVSPLPEQNSSELIYVLGALWANIVIKDFNWRWVTLTFHEFDDWTGRGVVSHDGALLIMPFAYIHDCLEGKDEVKVSASLVALSSDVIPNFPPNSYVNVMQGIQRIVPRG